jgi:hypothetical protein
MQLGLFTDTNEITLPEPIEIIETKETIEITEVKEIVKPQETIEITEVKEKTEDTTAHEYWKSWKPKKRKDLGKVDHSHKLTHGWFMPYLTGIDKLTNKRWEYWLRVQQLSPVAYYEYLTKGLTDKFVTEAIHCHDYPQLHFTENKQTYDYLQSVIDFICGDRSINGLDAFEFLMDWLLFGFGHEDFIKLPDPKGRDENVNSKLYEYFDLFPFLMNPFDYFGKLLPDLYGDSHKGKVGFFPTPMTVCVAIQQMLYSNSDKPTIKSFLEPSAGTGSLLLAWSNSGLCGSITELSNICTKASLVNSYFYAPQFARPIWYLADQSSFICGNTLSYEIFHDYHAKYRLKMADGLKEELAIA